MKICLCKTHTNAKIKRNIHVYEKSFNGYNRIKVGIYIFG